MAHFLGPGEGIKSQLLVHRGGEYGALYSGCSHRRTKEKALEHRTQQVAGRTDFFAKTRGSESDGCIFHAFLCPGDVAACGRKSSSRVLDQRSDHHVRPDIRRFYIFREFAIAIVNHDDDIRSPAADKVDHFADLGYGKGRSCQIPP